MTLDHDTRLFGHTTNWIVNYPLVTGILILAISGLATLGYLAPQTVLSLFSSVPVPADEPAMLSEENLDRPPDVDPFSLTNADAVIVVESEQFFTPAGARTRYDMWLSRSKRSITSPASCGWTACRC